MQLLQHLMDQPGTLPARRDRIIFFRFTGLFHVNLNHHRPRTEGVSGVGTQELYSVSGFLPRNGVLEIVG